MQHHASAAWQGNLKGGTRSLSTARGVLTGTRYSVGTRCETGIGTNPQELLAAAHAG